MDSREVTEVCRLCPGSNKSDSLINVFDERLSVRNNMKEVILVTTGIEILESDMVSQKVCQRCCNVTIRMFHFRQDAIKQDRFLKEKFNQILTEKGVRLPNTCVTIKRERAHSLLPSIKQNGETCEGSAKQSQIKLHPSVIEVYRNNPTIKLPKRCLSRHINPVVSLPMDQVESYFKERKLDMRKFIYKSSPKQIVIRQVARKKTAVPAKPRTVAPLLLSKSTSVSATSGESYVCTPMKEKGRKRKMSELKPRGRESPKDDASESSDSQETDGENTELKIRTTPAPKEDKAAVPDNTHQAGTSTESTETSSASKTSSNNSKPQFIESLGLVPTVTTTKSQTIHVCNLCGSVHNNAFKLKKHINKHMVCQFCKLKFKSLEAKQDHIEKKCQVKDILSSAKPVIDLEKVDQNVSMGEQFRNAFDAVGLESVEDDVLKSISNDASSPSTEQEAANKSASASVAEKNNPDNISPNVLITDDATLEGVNMEVSEDEVIKNLVERLEPQEKPTVIEKILQTDSVHTKDIKVNVQDSTCEFKGLRHLFNIYKIPITFTHGQFHVGYQFKKSTETNKVMATWNHLPLIDIQKKQQEAEAVSTSAPTPSRASKQFEKKSKMTKLKSVSSKRLASKSLGGGSDSKKTKIPLSKSDASSSLNKSLPPVLVKPSTKSSKAKLNRSLSAKKKTGDPGSSRKTTRVRVRKVWELQ